MPNSLADWLVKIEGMRPEVIKLGLERMQQVAQRLGVDELPGRVISVAGTNGKGSTVKLIDSLARAMGLTTGVYTSPHLFQFNERISLDGQPVDDAALCAAFEAVELARGDVALTYFEFTTLAGFKVFCEQPRDLYILEIGLGGRLDAVNAIDADVAVVTSIGLDHTDWLGPDRDSIGREKAAICRPSRPLLYGEADMPASVAAVAAEKGAILERAGGGFGFDAASQTLFWPQGRISLQQPITLGEDNLATALAALGHLNWVPDNTLIETVAAEARLVGRCEQRHFEGHDWWFDVGHNREAMARVASRLPPHQGRTLALCGMLIDKPAEAVLSLVSQVDAWFVTDLPGPRGGGVARFNELLPAAHSFHQLDAAFNALKAALKPGDRVLVIGSFVTVMAVEERLNNSRKEAS